MRFAIATLVPLVLAVAEEKKTRLLRRGGDKQLFDVAAPALPTSEVVKVIEEVNKAKEDEALWDRLLGETTELSFNP